MWCLGKAGEAIPHSDAGVREIELKTHVVSHLPCQQHTFPIKVDWILIPQPKRPADFLHEIAAARTAAGILPGFDGMLGTDRAGELEFFPNQWTHRSIQFME